MICGSFPCKATDNTSPSNSNVLMPYDFPPYTTTAVPSTGKISIVADEATKPCLAGTIERKQCPHLIKALATRSVMVSNSLYVNVPSAAIKAVQRKRQAPDSRSLSFSLRISQRIFFTLIKCGTSCSHPAKPAISSLNYARTMQFPPQTPTALR